MGNIITSIPPIAKHAIIFGGSGILIGAFGTMLYLKHGMRSPSKEMLDAWWESGLPYTHDEIEAVCSNIEEETVGDTALNSEKPDIFSLESDEEPEIVAVNVSKYPGEIIDMKAFQMIPEDNRHVCTYFIEDEILAGYDDDLDIIEPMAAYGGIPEEALDMLKYNASGVYVMCADHETALEIVGSHGNYLEEYNNLGVQDERE